jgi:hypothetical protein
MKAFVDDFRHAQAEGVAVRLTLESGEVLGLVGVRDVNDQEGYVSLHTPSHMQDQETTRKVALDRIESVEITDIKW